MDSLNLGIWAPFIIAIVLLFCWVIYITIRLSRVQKRYDQMMCDMDGKNLEGLFLARLKEITQAKEDIVLLERRCRDLDSKLALCVQKVGVVRFNAFNDTGSDLSYAVALLDQKGDGVVFSSIYGRNEARCYAKPIKDGKSGYLLTDEEKQAIDSKKI